MNPSSLPGLNGRYFLTPQEHIFVGSTVEKKYSQNPYRPIAVQEGWKVDVVDYIRQKTKVFYTSSINWLTEENQQYIENAYAKTLLSRLDETGNTVHDPVSGVNNLKINPARLEKLLIRSN